MFIIPRVSSNHLDEKYYVHCRIKNIFILFYEGKIHFLRQHIFLSKAKQMLLNNSSGFQ